MAEMRDYPPGTPSWVDLATTDLEGAKAFYGALFGWEFEDMGPEAGGYTMCALRGQQVAGLGPTMGEGIPPAWSTYVSVEDADTTAKAVESAGGSALAPPFDVFDSGRMAVFADPTGAAISVWQPKEHHGAGLVNEPGAFCWNELHTRDVEGAKKFYQTVFNWEGVTHDMGGMAYTELKLDEKSIAGMMAMGDEYPPEVPAHWLVYIDVEDTDATVAKATSLGGAVVSPPMDSPAGPFAVLRDPAGAVFAVIKV
jgi:predicted enzyme related to lactoylglutathione lyase